MGFLMIGFVNFISLALHVYHVSPGFPAFICPVVNAVPLFVVYVRVYLGEEKKGELFP